jgi:hypothetical protein
MDKPRSKMFGRRRRNRKQVYDLKVADFDRAPVWEFALDEEGDPGQDEATVRPRPDLRDGVDRRGGLFVVDACFVAADGTRFRGYVTPARGGIVDSQPTVITDDGQVGFWYGIVPPNEQTIAEAYRALGRTADQLFPLRFEAAVELARKDDATAGVIEGFSHRDASDEINHAR